MVRKESVLLLFQAEARLSARRQARYEARNIRMKELEKKQKEEDENTANSNNIYPGKIVPHFEMFHSAGANERKYLDIF